MFLTTRNEQKTCRFYRWSRDHNKQRCCLNAISAELVFSDPASFCRTSNANCHALTGHRVLFWDDAVVVAASSRDSSVPVYSSTPYSACVGLKRPKSLRRPSRNHRTGIGGRAGPGRAARYRFRLGEPRRRRRLSRPVDQTARESQRGTTPGGVNLFLIVSTDERLMTWRVSSGRCARRRTGHNGRVPAGKPGPTDGRTHKGRAPLISRRDI